MGDGGRAHHGLLVAIERAGHSTTVPCPASPTNGTHSDGPAPGRPVPGTASLVQQLRIQPDERNRHRQPREHRQDAVGQRVECRQEHEPPAIPESGRADRDHSAEGQIVALGGTQGGEAAQRIAHQDGGRPRMVRDERGQLSAESLNAWSSWIGGPSPSTVRTRVPPTNTREVAIRSRAVTMTRARRRRPSPHRESGRTGSAEGSRSGPDLRRPCAPTVRAVPRGRAFRIPTSSTVALRTRVVNRC